MLYNITRKKLREQENLTFYLNTVMDDCYIPNIKNSDNEDMAGIAQIKASSEKEGFEVKNIVSGVTRPTDTGVNMWSSDGISDGCEDVHIYEVRIY